MAFDPIRYLLEKRGPLRILHDGSGLREPLSDRSASPEGAEQHFLGSVLLACQASVQDARRLLGKVLSKGYLAAPDNVPPLLSPLL